MAPRTRWFVLTVSTPLVLLVTVGGLIGEPKAAPQKSLSDLRVFYDVVGLVMQAYVEPVDMDKVMDGAMRGLAEGLDPASAFLSPEEVKALESKAAMPAGDVGLMIERQFYLRVLGVREGSAAAKAGLQSGDYIRMIDGKPTRDMSAFTGRRLLRGAPGSKVSLTIIRGNTADPHVFELTRDVPSGPSATMKMVGDVAHVRVSSFDANLPATLKSVFDGLNGKASGAVIDLRGTSDGELETGIAAARFFVKSGTLAVRTSRKAPPVKILAAAGDGAITLPVVLLVSNGTANAAEVFAAALSGNKRADLVGEPTAGLASTQQLKKLPQGYGLWLTSERYMTVDGANPIHERGLPPTVGVQIPTVGFDELPPTTDVPLEKAIERLKTKR
jgi:carboxyl-terminal processing protease